MTNSEYLADLVKTQSIGKESMEAKDLQNRRAEVEDVLRGAFGEDNPMIRYAGSYAKGTMVRDSYDLDIACYFPSSMEDSLPDIRRKVQDVLAAKYNITSKSSAVRIVNTKGESVPTYHIDVVPGRFVDESKSDAFLHVAYGEKSRMKTNLDTHIAFIANSGRQDVLKLIKIWNVRNYLRGKSFVLDIFVIEALRGESGSLETLFKKALQEIADHFETAQVVDPANSGNIVSNAMDAGDKMGVVSAAKNALAAIEAADRSLDAWKALFNDQSKSAAIPVAAVTTAGYVAPLPIRNPLKPYGGSWEQ